MAIELTKERRISPPLWMVLLFLGITVVLVFLIASYLFFYFSHSGAIKKIAELDASMIGLNQNIKNKESELSLIQKKTVDYNKLVSNHKRLENVFKFIEKKVITNIWFDTFDFNTVADDIITLTGVGPNFATISQQVEVLKKEELVKEITIGGISINKDGEVAFELKVKFAPEIFSFNKEI